MTLHLLAGVEERRLWGYIKVLQDALRDREIEKAFHISGLINPPDGLTKPVDPKVLLNLLWDGVLVTAPGVYERAAARKAAEAEKAKAKATQPDSALHPPWEYGRKREGSEWHEKIVEGRLPKNIRRGARKD